MKRLWKIPTFLNEYDLGTFFQIILKLSIDDTIAWALG
jgi:hypothetical protein